MYICGSVQRRFPELLSCKRRELPPQLGVCAVVLMLQRRLPARDRWVVPVRGGLDRCVQRGQPDRSGAIASAMSFATARCGCGSPRAQQRAY
jgi:hypothetical protein